MATVTQVILTCDMCGNEQEVKTRAFGLDSKAYEIDLCPEDDKGLSKVAAGYVPKARKVTARQSARPGGQRSRSRTAAAGSDVSGPPGKKTTGRGRVAGSTQQEAETSRAGQQPAKPSGAKAKAGGASQDAKARGPRQDAKASGPSQDAKTGSPGQDAKPSGAKAKAGGASQDAKTGSPGQDAKPSGAKAKAGGASQKAKTGGPSQDAKAGGAKAKADGLSQKAKTGSPGQDAKAGSPSQDAKAGSRRQDAKTGGPSRDVEAGGPGQDAKAGLSEQQEPEATPQRAAQATGAQHGKGIYVYGILPADIEIAAEMPGVGEHPGLLRVVRRDGLAALISEVDLSGRLGSPADLKTHREILDMTAAEVPVLPLRQGTVLTGEDAVAEQLLAAYHDEFAAALEQLEGHAEFLIKGRYAGEAAAARREEDTRALREAMEGVCAASVVRDPAGERDAIHVACLVAGEQESELERVIDDLAREWEGRIEIQLLGPMAAYDFVTTANPEA